MKHSAKETPLAWFGLLALAIVLGGTLAAWAFSRQQERPTLLIEPLPSQSIEITAPDSTKNRAIESLAPGEDVKLEEQENYNARLQTTPRNQ